MLVDDAIVLGAKARLLLTGLAGGNIDVDRGNPTTDPILPYVNIYVQGDSATADGGPRTGVAKFDHGIMLMIEMLARGNTQRAVKAGLAIASEGILDALLADRKWALLGGKECIEGFGKINRMYDFPADGNHLLGRLQVQIEVLHRTLWAPSTDDLPDLANISFGVDLDNGDDTPPIGIIIDVPTD